MSDPDPPFVFTVICRHGAVQTTIRTDWPKVPEGLTVTHDTERPSCAPHYVRPVVDADS